MAIKRVTRKNKEINKPTFPEMDGYITSPSVEEYVSMLERNLSLGTGAMAKGHSPLDAILKGLQAPPQEFSYARISSMPDMYNEGVIQWPDLSPQAFQKVVTTNIAPQMIIGQRIDDVLMYARQSTHPYIPGWKILPRDGSTSISTSTKKQILDAERYLLQCNTETGWDARKRDGAGYHGWSTFLSSIIRDTLTYDAIAIFTDMDNKGRIKGFKALSAGNICLTGAKGYKNKKDVFAVGIDEAGNVITEFTRDNLIWYVRNPRTSPTVGGYGLSEIFVAIKVIGGLTNSLDLNLSVFDRNSIPNGMLLLKGMGWTQKQIDIMARLWTNLKQGTTKAWALPALAIPQDGDVDILDLSLFRNDMTIYYADFMNFAMAVFCCIYRFPYQRLGYRSTGTGAGTQMPNGNNPSPTDDADVGKAPLLGHIETLVNEYLLWPNWPDLQFQFTGKNPKEDNREFEFRVTSMTFSEKRASCGQPPLEDLVPKEFKTIATILGMSPVDPSLSGIYQNIMSAYIGNQNEHSPESLYPSKKDPAVSAEHGHPSGVRRDSKAEEKLTENNKKN